MRGDRQFAVLAAFDAPDTLIEAAESAYNHGYRRIEAYAPYPVEGLAEAVGHHHSKLPWIVLAGGLFGAIAGFFLQYWVSVIEYPMNIGGRPFNSWPAFIPITFETTVLCAAFAAVFGMLALNGLPRPHHPFFAVDGFERATRDGYFLGIAADDPLFDAAEVRAFFKSMRATEVHDVVE